MSQPLLEVKNLRKYFKTPKGMLHAVDDVTFTIEKGKTLGVVGESGCGKSTTGRAILRLIEPTAGEVLFEGQDVVKLSAEEMRKKRTDMQIIFQDPFSSLNPRKTISQIIADPLKINKIITDKNEQMDRVRELMETVGLADRLINTYPHELDGGRRQRIGIADNSAWVYGCVGWANSSSDGAFSISFPRYMTAMSSEKWFTTDRSWVMNM